MSRPKLTFLDHWTHDEVDKAVKDMYEGNEQFPLVSFLNKWKANRLAAPAPAVIQIVCAYRNLVNARGPRLADAPAKTWIRTVERMPPANTKPKA